MADNVAYVPPKPISGVTPYLPPTERIYSDDFFIKKCKVINMSGSTSGTAVYYTVPKNKRLWVTNISLNCSTTAADVGQKGSWVYLANVDYVFTQAILTGDGATAKDMNIEKVYKVPLQVLAGEIIRIITTMGGGMSVVLTAYEEDLSQSGN